MLHRARRARRAPRSARRPRASPPCRGDTAEFSKWSPIFRVDVQEVVPGSKLLYHDGLVGSRLSEWDGERSSLERFDTDIRSFPFAGVGERGRTT